MNKDILLDKEIDINLSEIFSDKYFIYNGADSIEEMNENIEVLKLNRARCYFIELNNQFYAVFFNSFSKEIIIGRNKVFFTRNGRIVESTIKEANIGYAIDHRRVMWITNTMAKELNYMFDSISIFKYATVNSKDYREVKKDIRLSNYIVLLALTFASRFYSEDEVEIMRNYFIHTEELISFLKRTKGAVAIDPFSQEIKFIDGSIGTYSYKRVLETNYYPNMSNNNYSNSNIGFKTIFALEDKNKFSPYRKREWPSMSRYRAMYPEDDSLHAIPDFRDGEHICKWCGKSLPEGKRSYCSVDCRIDFGRAVNVERGASLPYMIMCRDRFICQICGKDMAVINSYGMKIPISRLSERPDKDGLCRSEAEIDHLIAVEKGGSNHESNLGTKCQECHKNKHRKRLK